MDVIFCRSSAHNDIAVRLVLLTDEIGVRTNRLESFRNHLVSDICANKALRVLSADVCEGASPVRYTMCHRKILALFCLSQKQTTHRQTLGIRPNVVLAVRTRCQFQNYPLFYSRDIHDFLKMFDRRTLPYKTHGHMELKGVRYTRTLAPFFR